MREQRVSTPLPGLGRLALDPVADATGYRLSPLRGSSTEGLAARL